MDVRDRWLVKLVERQNRHESAIRNGEYLRQIQARRSVRRAHAARLRLASYAATLAWLFATLQGWLKS